MPSHPSRRLVLGAIAAVTLAGSAFAHHGWAWTVDEQTELTGTIQDIFIGPARGVERRSVRRAMDC
jgi:hypothetical protein